MRLQNYDAEAKKMLIQVRLVFVQVPHNQADQELAPVKIDHMTGMQKSGAFGKGGKG